MTGRSAGRLALALFLALAAAPASRSAHGQVRERDLGQPYREWLNAVAYIILPAERDVFMKLTTDRDRDLFIAAFWRQRDPTPETPQNEYKDEHLRRFQYANDILGRGTPRDGWRTDQGRIWILLGKPNSVEHFDATLGIHPCQVWYYFGDAAKGLPTYFGLLFYQRGGGGEYKLYNPASDGPASLLVDTRNIDTMNTVQVYQKIKQLAPTLAGPSISLIPNETASGYAPSPRSSILLAQILDSPRKDVRTAYATHFLDYKGSVSTEYLTNYVESDAACAVIRDARLGLPFLHFAVSPRKMSVDHYGPTDQYYSSYKLNVSLRKQGAVIFQYSKDLPFYFPPDRLQTIQANGIAIHDAFPVIAGTYELTVLLQNAVGKEFTVFERSVSVPPREGPPGLTGPVIGYGIEDDPRPETAPFRVAGRLVKADPKGTLAAKDDLVALAGLVNLPREVWADGQVVATIEPAGDEGRALRSLTIRLADTPYESATAVLAVLKAAELPPDYYRVKMSLRDGAGNVLADSAAPFIVSSAEAVPHPVTLSRPLGEGNDHLYVLGAALQSDQVGDLAEAEALYREARALKPDHADGTIKLADLLIRAGKPGQALEEIEALSGFSPARFEFLLIKGLALRDKGEYEPAVQALIEANKIYNSDTRVLNALGFCFYKTGQKKAALDALNASLRLNPAQPEAKDLLARVEKELK
jgi:GWxTD domain-containing protein